MKEVWKNVPIEGYGETYHISNKGRLKNVKRNRIHAICLDDDGYPHYQLCANNKRKTITAHRLVALAFIENPLNLPCVNHKDEVKTNNSVENLEWCTYEYNINYGTARKRIVEKQSKPIIQMSNGEVLAVFKSAVEASKQTGTNYSKIRMVCRGERKSAGGYQWKECKGEENV